jgi:hypothetical protein
MATTKYKIIKDLYSRSEGKTHKKGTNVSVDSEIGQAWERQGLAVEIKSKPKKSE